jgi:hypothetical protein
VSLAQTLSEFKASVAQCESLISNAHRVDAAGSPILPPLDQQQITVAAFLNMFIAWEGFLESSLAKLMTGSPTINGTSPIKYVSPLTIDAAKVILIGVGRYFDYGNHANVQKIVRMYFERGYPYEPHLGAIFSELEDLRAMRNWSAHITSTTQRSLEALAARILGQPSPGIDLYSLLTMIDPRSPSGETVFASYKTKLIVVAEIVAQG